MLKLVVIKGHREGNYKIRYGIGMTHEEALEDLRKDFRLQDNYTGSFWTYETIVNCENKTYVNIPDHWKSKWGLVWIYWFFHWLAVNMTAIKYFHRIYPFHDIDKPIKVTMGIPYIEVNRAHKFAKHHVKHRMASEVRWKEAICDWEASAFSKPQAPLNALGTWYKYFRDTYQRKEFVIRELERAKLI